MISSVHISNFKSVSDLKLDLGRFNIFIGENGCGKSNILEAIAFGGAAASDKLEHEFMSSRGIRLVEPQLMFSAFNEYISSSKSLNLNFNNRDSRNGEINLIFEVDKKQIQFFLEPKKNDGFRELGWYDTELANYLEKIVGESGQSGESFDPENNELVEFNVPPMDPKEYQQLSLKYNYLQKLKKNRQLADFLIYAPENSCLRKFEDEGQILPLGYKGEGLYNHLKNISIQQPEKLEEITESLHFLDWFEEVDWDVSSDIFNERKIKIKDRFLHTSHNIFDQRSANEGFLFLLFYATLFISDQTPQFFAIDNIDTALNPKLCEELIISLNQLSKKHNKQVILTTHNPAVLDGLNITDPEQKLFVIYRNLNGHTIAEQIKEVPKTETEMKLSEMWMRGLLGGLPNF